MYNQHLLQHQSFALKEMTKRARNAHPSNEDLLEAFRTSAFPPFVVLMLILFNSKVVAVFLSGDVAPLYLSRFGIDLIAILNHHSLLHVDVQRRSVAVIEEKEEEIDQHEPQQEWKSEEKGSENDGYAHVRFLNLASFGNMGATVPSASVMTGFDR